jgi:tRNA (mo5U34)-methyltransferase
VTAIDCDNHYLAQARWAAREFELERKIEFRRTQVYDLAEWREPFDLVLFMGVFYHLRYPLLALDIVSRLVVKLMVFQTLTMPGDEVREDTRGLSLEQREAMLDPGWPKMAFIEHELAGDPTNWWAPNHAAVEALLRASGMRVIARPGHEIYLCEPGEAPPQWVRDELVAAIGGRR